MAKRVLLVVTLFLASALVSFDGRSQDRGAFPDARDRPHDPQQLYVPGGEFMMGEHKGRERICLSARQGSYTLLRLV